LVLFRDPESVDLYVWWVRVLHVIVPKFQDTLFDLNHPLLLAYESSPADMLCWLWVNQLDTVWQKQFFHNKHLTIYLKLMTFYYKLRFESIYSKKKSKKEHFSVISLTVCGFFPSNLISIITKLGIKAHQLVKRDKMILWGTFTVLTFWMSNYFGLSIFEEI
jgi:hypothetical protein